MNKHLAQTRKLTATLLSLLAGTALTVGAAHAQFGGGMPTGPGGPFGGGQPNAPGGGGSPFSTTRMPFALGTITAVNAGAGTITVRSQFGGELRTIKITTATDITARVEAKVSDLKVGDTVQVRGVPTGITASQISAGDAAAPDPMMGAPMMGGNPMGGGTFGQGRPNGVAEPGGPGAAYAQASGKIIALTPLTIALPGGVSVTLTAAPNAKISRTVSEKIGSLKVGDTVMASGQPAADGSLAATRLRVNDNAAAGFGG